MNSYHKTDSYNCHRKMNLQSLKLQKCKNNTGVSVAAGEPKAIAASNFANAKRSRDVHNQNFSGQTFFFHCKRLNE